MSLDGSLVATGDAAGDTVSNFENLTGSATGDDTLRGDSGNNVIAGLGGQDILSGGAGGDTLDGGDDFDFADYRGEGGVIIDMQAGTFEGAAAGDSFISIEGVFGGDGDNVIRGDGNDNTFIMSNGDNTLAGRGGADTINGGSGQDTITGGAEGDTISGGGNQDSLDGNAGIDTISGGGGADEITGGADDDTLTGNGGHDTFIFNGANAGQDTITDFQDDIDLIQFHSGLVDSFADLTISGNGTDHVTIAYGDNSIDLVSDHTITLTADDFVIL
jgi:Ca2+-binding RTX toxin-like protein